MAFNEKKEFIRNPFRVGEIVESLEHINNQLVRDFGQESDGSPRWRVVWSDTLVEKRLMKTTDEGLDLLFPEVREVRKYQHISERYVLERQVPVIGETDVVTKTSFEPAWTFQDRYGDYLPPRFDACKFLIDGIHGQMDKKNTHKRYKDETRTPEARLKDQKEMEFYLFGNETPVGDALAHGFGVAGFHENKELTDKREIH